jgi:hypothetical protein
VNELQRAFEKLDRSLTGKVETSIRNAYPTSAVDRAFGDRMVYLSDGGYSRVYLDVDASGERAVVVLGSESRNEVKRRWKVALPLVDEIRRLFQTEIDRELGR